MFNIFDKFGNWINESCFYDSTSSYTSAQTNSLIKSLKGFHAVDTPLNGVVNSVSRTPKRQLKDQALYTITERNKLFDRIDTIKYNHMAITIKDILISDGFNDLCGGEYAMSIVYRTEDEEDKKELNKEIKSFLKRTKLIEILKDCVANEGLDYCELFLSTPAEYGRGVTKVYDNLDLREYLAIYKNTELVGALKFNVMNKNHKNSIDFIPEQEISHFMLNYRKLPIMITKDYNEKYDIPEKLRCAYPILAPVVDLIIQYNILEKIRTALELIKATQPITMGVAVSPDQDLGEVSRQLQELTIAMNKNKNNVLSSLESLDVSTLLNSMQTIELVPYTPEQGYNSLRQVQVRYQDSNLNDKINDLRKTIALAVGIPDQYLATTTYAGAKDNKEDSLLTNPRYSAMLSKIQQLLAKGIIDLIYKHLRYKYSTKEGMPTRVIDRDKIEVLFNSSTNLNERLEDENLQLNSDMISRIMGTIDALASSQNFRLKVNGEEIVGFWKQQMCKDVHLRNALESMSEEEIKQLEASQLGLAMGVEGQPMDNNQLTPLEANSVNPELQNEAPQNDENIEDRTKDSRNDIRNIFK